MPTFLITGPDGKKYRVKGETAEGAKAALKSMQMGEAQAKPEDKGDGFFRNIDSAVRGAADIITFGLADEISGGLSALTGIGGDFGDFSGNIQEEREIQRFRDNQDPIASNAGRLAGGVAMAVRGGRLGLPRIAPKTPALGSRIAAGAKEGTLYGGLYGAGSGEGAQDRVGDAVAGAATGGLLGAAVPAVASGVRSAAKPLTDAISARRNPAAYGARKVQERLAASGMSPQQAAKRMEGAPGSNLADVSGSSTRDLLRTTTNIPGPARDRVAKQLTLRQMGQGDRLKAMIRRTFADPDGYLQTKDALVREAEEAAGPLYEKARKIPVHFSEDLESILQTGAGKKALRAASEIASNEQIPFRQIFARELDDGSFEFARAPDLRGWDYIKRAMDDMIDDQTDAITGKVTNQGRAIIGLKNRMLALLDKANPYYKQARAAYAGPKQIEDALEFGKKAKSMSPEALQRGVSEMTEAQRKAARIGAAETIRNDIDKAGWTHNAILKIFNSRDQYKKLRALFDNDEAFGVFTKNVMAEARKRATYDAVKGNSTTARQLADMAESGGLAEGADIAQQVARGDVVGAGMKWLGSRLKMLGGFTPEVADEVAKRLTSSDPGAARRLMTEISRIEKQAISAEQKRALIESLVTRSIAAPAVSAISQN